MGAMVPCLATWYVLCILSPGVGSAGGVFLTFFREYYAAGRIGRIARVPSAVEVIRECRLHFLCAIHIVEKPQMDSL